MDIVQITIIKNMTNEGFFHRMQHNNYGCQIVFFASFKAFVEMEICK